MTYSRRIGAVMVMVAAMAGCGDDGGGGSVSIEDLPDALVDAFCGRLVRCGLYVSLEECEAGLPVNFDEIQHSVAAGRIEYDGEKAADCLAAFAASSCDTTSESVRREPAACAEAVRGAVADGGTCWAGNECVSGDCNQPNCTMACCQGTCNPTVAEAQLGQSCVTAACVEGTFCNGSDVCAGLLAVGAACDFDDQCNYGLSCVNDACVTAAHRGNPCNDGDCADIGDVCGPATTCVALSGRGGACRMGFAGTFDCQRPLVCNATSLVCEDPPTAGEACQFFCGGGAFCNDQATCEAPRANGAACTGNDECASGFCDEEGTSQCANAPVCG